MNLGAPDHVKSANKLGNDLHLEHNQLQTSCAMLNSSPGQRESVRITECSNQCASSNLGGKSMKSNCCVKNEPSSIVSALRTLQPASQWHTDTMIPQLPEGGVLLSLRKGTPTLPPDDVWAYELHHVDSSVQSCGIYVLWILRSTIRHMQHLLRH